MAERHRSKDGVQETKKITDDAATPSFQDRAGGETKRRVGTRDEMRRATEDAGITRITDSDKEGGSSSG